MIDRYMINDIGIPGAILMENAAMRTAEAVMQCGRSGLCAVLIGPGNNGGDGLALMRILAAHGRESVGVLLCDPEKLSGDAAQNYSIAKKLGLALSDDLSFIDNAEVIVDAVFGTGLSRNIDGKQLEALRRANSTDAYRIAVDIPSGINGDTGRIMGYCFNADETVAVFAVKRGLLLTERLESVGTISVARIGLVDAKMQSALDSETIVDEAFVRSLLPGRKRVSNKGNYGRTLIVAGSQTMPGAAVMCTRAALRAGSGLTQTFVPAGIESSFAATPETMLIVDDGTVDLDEMLRWPDAVCFGCGTGNDPRKFEKAKAVLCSGKPAVIDADGLNLMTEELKQLLCANHVITPHPGEMSRLTGAPVSEVLADPVAFAVDFAKKYGCTVLLKSAVSVIASPDGRIRYNTAGNAGLAKGGSGDVLCGIIGALLAAGLSPFDAAGAGAFLLGSSADTAMKLLKERMLTASDVVSALQCDLC